MSPHSNEAADRMRAPRTRGSRLARMRAACTLAALLLPAGCGAASSASASNLRGTVLPQPIEKHDFTLTDTKGNAFHFRQATDGYLTLLFFGYTSCPNVCPVHMANIGAVLQRFPAETRERVKVVFVSTDPARDTPGRIRSWLDTFDTDFIGLRGDTAEVNRIMGLYFLPSAEPEPPGKDGGYIVGHAAHVIAFTPDNQAHVLYPFGTRQDDWQHDIPVLLGAHW